jgi:anti-sigma B factor antagonist
MLRTCRGNLYRVERAEHFVRMPAQTPEVLVTTPEMGASFERADRAGERILVVTGEIDIATAPQLRCELEALSRGAHSSAVVDLAGVTFLDSSGISALVAARQALAGTDATLVLLEPSPPVRLVLEMSGVDGLFEIRDAATAAGETTLRS